MVPIYSIDSWISLRWIVVAPYLNLVRDAYEGYVLFSFFELLVTYVEKDQEGFCGELLAEKPPLKLALPLCCFHFRPGPYFLLWVKRMTLQFALVKPLFAIIALVLEPFELFGKMCREEIVGIFIYDLFICKKAMERFLQQRAFFTTQFLPTFLCLLLCTFWSYFTLQQRMNLLLSSQLESSCRSKRFCFLHFGR